MQDANFTVSKATIKDQIYTALKRDIVTGKMKPGDPINILALTNKMNTSAAPLREALNLLARDGLVTLVPRRHAVVSEITEKDMVTAMEMRLLLEPYAIENSIDDIPKAEIDRIRAILNRVLLDPSDFEGYIDSDQALHTLLFRFSDSSVIRKTLSVLTDCSLPTRYYAEIYGNFEDEMRRQTVTSSTWEHLAILDAIEQHDISAVKDLVCRHIKNGTERNKYAITRSEIL